MFRKKVSKSLIVLCMIAVSMLSIPGKPVIAADAGNTSSTATNMGSLGGDGSSLSTSEYINPSGDIDWFYFTGVTRPSRIRVTLTVPSGKNYDVYAYDKDLVEIGKGTKGTGYSEDFYINISTQNIGKVYLKVIGVSGSYSSSASYTLKAQNSPDKAIKAVRDAYTYAQYNTSWQGRWSGDKKPGVAYSWANKDTTAHFGQKLSENTSAGVSNTVWTNQFNFTGGTYNNNPYSPNISTVKKYGLGLYGTTSWAGGPAYNNPTKWAGIDCSGLVQRAQYYAGYDIANIGNGAFNTWGNEVPASWWANTSRCDPVSFGNIKIGDVVTYPATGEATHVMLVSHVPYTDTQTVNNVKIIHAFSKPDNSTYGRRCQETTFGAVNSNKDTFKIWRKKV